MTKQHDVPLIWQAALLYIDGELRQVMERIYKTEYESPFSKQNVNFSCPVFTICADSDDFDVEQPWNFKWRNVEISWYKRFGRCLSVLSSALTITWLQPGKRIFTLSASSNHHAVT